MLDFVEFARGIKMTKRQIAETHDLASSAFAKTKRPNEQISQKQMRETSEVLKLIEKWAGGKVQAMAWYKSYPIPALNGQTSEQLVKDGKFAAVREYINHLVVGGYA